MATPNYSEVINQINTYIVANGNNEITANVLNPILKLLTDFANNSMGDFDALTTDASDNLVAAINSLKQNIEDSENNSVKLHTGIDNPNITPPASFNYADYYMQIDELDNSAIQLYQWTGYEWRSIGFTSQTDYRQKIFLTTNPQTYNLPINTTITGVNYNGVPLDFIYWNKVGDSIIFTQEPDPNGLDEINILGITQN